MKALYTFVLVMVTLSGFSQFPVYWRNDVISNTHYSISWSSDDAQTYYDAIVLDSASMTFRMDSIRWETFDVSRIGTAPQMLLSMDANGYIWPVELADIAGYIQDTCTFSGLSSTVTYVINHGLSFTPSQVHIQPINQDAAEWAWVSNITSSTFSITFVVNPTTGSNNISFAYVAYR